MSYTTGYDTQYRCFHCSRKYSENDLIDWKCPKCNRYIQIAAPDLLENGHVLIRKKAADLQIGESIYLTGQKDYEILNISKNKDKKLRIALKDYGDLTVDKNDFFNVIDGGYFEKDWVSENEDSAE